MFIVLLEMLWVFMSVVLIGIILLQRGRGGGLVGALGGAGGNSAFGTKAGDVFTRITVGIFAAWLANAILLVWLCRKEATLDKLSAPPETVKADAPKADAPKADAPKADAPKADAPKADAPKADAPKADAPKADAPKADAPKAEPAKPAPTTEAKKADAPKAEPAKPAPTPEAKKAEPPKAEAKDAKAPAGAEKK